MCVESNFSRCEISGKRRAAILATGNGELNPTDPKILVKYDIVRNGLQFPMLVRYE